MKLAVQVRRVRGDTAILGQGLVKAASFVYHHGYRDEADQQQLVASAPHVACERDYHAEGALVVSSIDRHEDGPL